MSSLLPTTVLQRRKPPEAATMPPQSAPPQPQPQQQEHPPPPPRLPTGTLSSSFRVTGSDDAGDNGGQSSSSAWRAQLRLGLKRRLLTLANLWTCTLVLTVLLALVFRAMQPTEAPAMTIRQYGWELDPSNSSQVRMVDMVLDVRGIGRYILNFGEATLLLSEPPPEQGPPPADLTGLQADVGVPLARMPVPPWELKLGHSNLVVVVPDPSDYFPYRPEAVPDVVVSAQFDGLVTVFASLPSRISMYCRVRAALDGGDPPICVSQYLPHMCKG